MKETESNEISEILENIKDKKINRRGFFKKILMFGGAIALSPIIKYCKNDTNKSTNNSQNNNTGNDKPYEPTLYDIPENNGDILSYPGDKLIVMREDDKVYALSNVCNHMNCIVSYNKDGKNFICPCHQSKFNRDGTLINGPASSGLDRYTIRLQGISKVEIDTRKSYREGSTQYSKLFVKLG